MKKFLLKCLCFFFSLLILGFLWDTVASHILRNSENVRYKRWESLYQPIEADLLIVGNSRAANHVDPFKLDSIFQINTYNLGISGGPIEFSDAAWKLYRSHNKKIPRVVLCNVDFLWLGDYKLSYPKEDYLLYLHDSCFLEIVKDINNSLAELYIPGVKYMGRMAFVFDNLRKTKENSNESRGIFFRKGAILLDQEYRPLNFLPASCHFTRSEKRINLFNQFIDECRLENIPVILFLSPIQEAAYKDLSGIDDSFALIDSLARSQNLPVLDYTDYMIADSSLFWDPAHLNKKGVELFSVRLAHDVDSLLKTLNIEL